MMMSEPRLAVAALPSGKSPITHCRRGWEVLKTSLDRYGERKYLALPEFWMLDCPSVHCTSL